jgi:Ras-related protein Rab-18
MVEVQSGYGYRAPTQDNPWNVPSAFADRLLALLDEIDIVRLSRTCLSLHARCVDAVLWMELFARRFRYLPPYTPTMKVGDKRLITSTFWISQFARQRIEVSVFGSLRLLPQLQIPDTQIVRVVLIGPCNVGKSSLVRVLREPIANDNVYEPTAFVRTSSVYGFVGGAKRVCGAKFWDIPGDPRNRSVSTVYCADTQCVLFVFDCSRRESFDQLCDWILNARLHIHKNQKTRLAIIASKYDLGMSESVERAAREFAKRERIPFIRISALHNVYEWRLFCWKLVADVLRIAFV